MTPFSLHGSGHSAEYPHYYVLDVADIVEELLEKWHQVIANEIAEHANPAAEHAYPTVYRIDPGNGGAPFEVYLGQHQQVRQRPWRPDVSFIVHHVIDIVKKCGPGDDIDMLLQELEYDIATMAHHQLLPNVPKDSVQVAYEHGRVKLARLAGIFGKQLMQRFVTFRLYQNGYFPYHFAGWQDTCVIVTLDDTHA